MQRRASATRDGVSIDGGNTFTDYIVFDDTTRKSDFGHAFVNVSVDKAGNVYVVYSDDHNLFYSFSRTFGKTWFGPFRINQAPSNTAIYPWIVAVSAGKLDVVWYGTSFTGATPTNFPHCSSPPSANDPCLKAPWYVYFAQNVNALTPGSPFTQVVASQTVSGPEIIHYGDVCELGAGCGSNQNRDLLDDFGVSASPTTGMAAIIYTSDQFLNSPLEPANTYGSRPCNAAQTNGFDCIHTNIATQTGGSGINRPPGEFEVDDEDFEETNVNNNGGQSPHFEMDLTNRGIVTINKLDIGISGLPWAVTWSSTSPIQPG
jgi:hypothetical protein